MNLVLPLNKVIILPVLMCLFAIGENSQFGGFEYLADSSRVTISLAAFGGRPNDPNFDSRGPFLRALESLKSQGGGTLAIPPGDYYLKFDDIASDVDPRDVRNTVLLQEKHLQKGKLILIPAGVILQGTSDGAGKQNTRIHWTATSFPLFSFIHSDGSGIRDVAFFFDGVQPQFFPWSQEKFLEEVGYPSRWLGGPYELSAAIYAIGSSGLHFENLSFQSSKTPPDNEHAFAFGIVIKGKSPVIRPDVSSLKGLRIGSKVLAGGLSECVQNNVFRSLRFRDYIMGVVASGQCRAIVENIDGDYRGSWYRSFDPSHEEGPELTYVGPPGHLIYLTFQNTYDVQHNYSASGYTTYFHSTIRNKDVTIRNVTEGSETLSNRNSLGTLALKNMDGGYVSGIFSKHPAGLLQSMVDSHGVLLENLEWSSNRNICDDAPPPTSCGVPVITLEPGSSDFSTPFSSDVQFKNIKLQSIVCPVGFKISEENAQMPLSRNIMVDNLSIECKSTVAFNYPSQRGVITLRSSGTHLTNVHYSLLLPNDTAPESHDHVVVIQSRSTDTTVDITIENSRNRTNNASAYECMVEDRGKQDTKLGSDNKCTIRFR